MAVTRAFENIGIHSETTPRFGQEEIHGVNAGAVPAGYTPFHLTTTINLRYNPNHKGEVYRFAALACRALHFCHRPRRIGSMFPTVIPV